jgi:osmotically-inducible protein OsmY
MMLACTPGMRLLAFGALIGFLAYVLRSPPRREAVPDDELITKIRLRLNELLEHPGSVNIAVLEGRVTLTGPVAEPELRKVMRAVRAMPGVRRIECRLSPHTVPA